MGKLEAKTIARERRACVSPIRRTKNRAGIIESSVKICGECGEEFCFGESCGDTLYDSFTRIAIVSQQTKIKVSADTEAIIANMDRKKKKKRKKRIKSKSRTPRRGVRLLVRSKGKKSTNGDGESKGKKGKAETDEPAAKSVKPFKRKCTKYTKRGSRR